jgi:hypothetical protein
MRQPEHTTWHRNQWAAEATPADLLWLPFAGAGYEYVRA